MIKKFFNPELFSSGTDLNIKSTMSKFPLNISDCSYTDQMAKKIMIYEIHKHLNLIEQSEIFINKRVIECLETKALSLKKFLLPIYCCSTFDNDQCRYDPEKINEEIDRMKKIKVGKTTSLHEILKSDPHKIWARSYDYESFLKSSDFKKKFPISGGAIKGHFAKSLVRRYVTESTKNYFRSLININLPDLCCEEIFRYLSNECLFHLCLASMKS